MCALRYKTFSGWNAGGGVPYSWKTILPQAV